jgi:hypothetical protein
MSDGEMAAWGLGMVVGGIVAFVLFGVLKPESR